MTTRSATGPPMMMTLPNRAPGTAHRYAVYFPPHPGSTGWLAGSHWLGRCAALLQPMQQLAIEGVAAQDLYRLTAAPRRYGWHATLKAPFALAPGADWITLHQTARAVAPSPAPFVGTPLPEAVRAGAQTVAPFALPPLHVAPIDAFLARVPAPAHAANAAIERVAAACVTQLQPLAAPLSDADLARRRCAALTPRQD